MASRRVFPQVGCVSGSGVLFALACRSRRPRVAVGASRFAAGSIGSVERGGAMPRRRSAGRDSSPFELRAARGDRRAEGREESPTPRSPGVGCHRVHRLARAEGRVDHRFRTATRGTRPRVAQAAADRRARRCGTGQAGLQPASARAVQAGLEEEHSPEQISERLNLDFPDDPEMRVSHETIYKALYVQGRGELRRDLHKRLRTGRAVRKPRRAVGERRGQIPGHGQHRRPPSRGRPTGPCRGTGKAT